MADRVSVDAVAVAVDEVLQGQLHSGVGERAEGAGRHDGRAAGGVEAAHELRGAAVQARVEARLAAREQVPDVHEDVERLPGRHELRGQELGQTRRRRVGPVAVLRHLGGDGTRARRRLPADAVPGEPGHVGLGVDRRGVAVGGDAEDAVARRGDGRHVGRDDVAWSGVGGGVRGDHVHRHAGVSRRAGLVDRAVAVVVDRVAADLGDGEDFPGASTEGSHGADAQARAAAANGGRADRAGVAQHVGVVVDHAVAVVIHAVAGVDRGRHGRHGVAAELHAGADVDAHAGAYASTVGAGRADARIASAGRAHEIAADAVLVDHVVGDLGGREHLARAGAPERVGEAGAGACVAGARHDGGGRAGVAGLDDLFVRHAVAVVVHVVAGLTHRHAGSGRAADRAVHETSPDAAAETSSPSDVAGLTEAAVVAAHDEGQVCPVTILVHAVAGNLGSGRDLVHAALSPSAGGAGLGASAAAADAGRAGSAGVAGADQRLGDHPDHGSVRHTVAVVVDVVAGLGGGHVGHRRAAEARAARAGESSVTHASAATDAAGLSDAGIAAAGTVGVVAAVAVLVEHVARDFRGGGDFAHAGRAPDTCGAGVGAEAAQPDGCAARPAGVAGAGHALVDHAVAVVVEVVAELRRRVGRRRSVAHDGAGHAGPDARRLAHAETDGAGLRHRAVDARVAAAGSVGGAGVGGHGAGGLAGGEDSARAGHGTEATVGHSARTAGAVRTTRPTVARAAVARTTVHRGRGVREQVDPGSAAALIGEPGARSGQVARRRVAELHLSVAARRHSVAGARNEGVPVPRSALGARLVPDLVVARTRVAGVTRATRGDRRHEGGDHDHQTFHSTHRDLLIEAFLRCNCCNA